MDIKAIGKRIKFARNQNKLTIAQLAETVGLETVSLAHIESGNRATSLSTLIMIADTLNVSMDFLTARDEQNYARLILSELPAELDGLTPRQAETLDRMLKPVLEHFKQEKK